MMVEFTTEQTGDHLGFVRVKTVNIVDVSESNIKAFDTETLGSPPMMKTYLSWYVTAQ